MLQKWQTLYRCHHIHENCVNIVTGFLMLWCDVVLHDGRVVTDFWTTIVSLQSGVQQFLYFLRCGWNKDLEICRRCKLARLRTKFNSTNISHYQTVHSVAGLQVGMEKTAFGKWAAAAAVLNKTVVDSREWLVILLASWTTGITSPRDKKKRKC